MWTCVWKLGLKSVEIRAESVEKGVEKCGTHSRKLWKRVWKLGLKSVEKGVEKVWNL